LSVVLFFTRFECSFSRFLFQKALCTPLHDLDEIRTQYKNFEKFLSQVAIEADEKQRQLLQESQANTEGEGD
jgi:hypothetical protein